MELRVLYRDEGEITAEAGPLFMRVVSGETSSESVDRLLAQIRDMLERWPLVAILVAVEHGSPRPSTEIRKRVDLELSRLGARVVIGYAFLGIGFWNTDAREFGNERAKAIGVPVLVAGSVRELVSQLAFELIGVDVGQIEDCLEQLRELR